MRSNNTESNDYIVLPKNRWDIPVIIACTVLFFTLEYKSFAHPISSIEIILLSLFCACVLCFVFRTIRITKDKLIVAIGPINYLSISKERIAHTQVISYQHKVQVVFVLDNCPEYSVESGLSVVQYTNRYLFKIVTYTIPPKEYNNVINSLGEIFTLELLKI